MTAKAVHNALPITKPKLQVGFSAEEFLMKYDAPTKIAAGLAKLGARCMHESDLVKLCGLSQQQFTAHREGFKDFIIREPQSERDKRVWGGTKAFAAKLRGPVNE